MHPNEHCNCRYADVGCDRMEQVMDQISGKWKMRILIMVGAHGYPQDAVIPVEVAGCGRAGSAHRLQRGPAPGRVPPDRKRRGADADF